MSPACARLTCCLALVMVAVPVSTRPAGAELAVGDRAPEFELRGSDGKLYGLGDLLADGGLQGIVLAWFPKAFTPG